MGGARGVFVVPLGLDKSRIIGRCAPQDRGELSPVKGVAPLKKSMTVEAMSARSAASGRGAIVGPARRQSPTDGASPLPTALRTSEQAAYLSWRSVVRRKSS